MGVLAENRESKNINLARRYLRENGFSLDKAQEILDAIRSSMHNARVADSKFLLGITRLYLNGELKDETSIFNLNRILPYVGSDAHVDEYKPNLNDLSLEELVKRFSVIAQQDAEGSRANSYAKEHVRNNDYTIVRIPSFEDAERYSRYTTWCVTHSKDMYQKYTNDGLGLFYFCLRNGFEKVKRDEGENCPLDKYGLSMIAVSITKDGEPNTITCRWNHNNGGNDNVISKDQLEELLGVNFYETFKPYSDEEIAQKNEELIRAFREAKEKLEQGASLGDIFDSVSRSSEGFSKVGLKNKYSFVDSNHELIGDGELWFDDVWSFSEGFARVRLNDKWSFLNTKGELIGDGELWFDECERFKGGLAAVVLNNKYSFINAKGELIGDGELWFDGVYKFNEGFVRVRLRDKWSFINTKGELIGNGKLWFDYADDFQDGLASINLGDKWSFINTKGELIGDGKLWFDVCDSFKGGFAKVKVNDKWSFINTKGELIGNGKLWFDDVEPFYNWFAKVYTNRSRYAIDKDGNLYDYMTLQPIPNPLKENKRSVKTIIMSESKLHNILLELDWKTYGNAMLKSKRLANSLPKNDINRYINDKRSKNFAFQFDNDLLKQYNLDPLEYDNAMTWISSNGDAGYEPDLNVLKRVKMVNKELDMLATNRYKYIKGKGWTNIDNL